MGCISPKGLAPRAAIAAALVALAAPSAFADACDPAQVDLRGDWGQAQFSVEVADDPGERGVGLMNRPNMPRRHGMLFVYERPQRAIFWMKNTLIPLDMVFLDDTGRVTHVHENAVPLDLTQIDGGEGVQYVLEVNGGLTGLYGIDVGTELRHPAISSEQAAWPCEP
jgi:uncharacterized membrane protein (UPF0127 family)